MKTSPMPVIAGVINLISGVLSLTGFALFFFFSIATSLPVIKMTNCDFEMNIASGILFVISSILLVIGFTSLFGGVCSLQRKKWGWALAGSICSLVTKLPLGIASIILVVLSRDEFRTDS